MTFMRMVVVALFLLPAVAFGSATRPAPPVTGWTLYDSGLVAAGAAITTSVLDTSRCETLMIYAHNASGTNTRAIQFWVYKEDGSTEIIAGNTLVTVAVSMASAIYSIGHGAVSGGVVTGALGFSPPPKMKLTLAAGGSSNGRLTVMCR